VDTSYRPNLGNLAVLGSTGSIGKSTLELVRAFPGEFRVACLAARSSSAELIAQAREFEPELIAVSDDDAADVVSRELGSEFQVVSGEDALLQAATHESVHSVVAAVVGFAGLESVLAALDAGKHVALANKESLVAGGFLVERALATSSGSLIPIDSEHSSVFQCMLTRREDEPFRAITITASGGPFLHHRLDQLRAVVPADAVKHPRWQMGAKISVDSATMMNKALELIEASWLFHLGADSIRVLIHPQSIVHGLLEFTDGTIVAVMHQTDMRVPIAYALGYLRSEDPRLNPGARLNFDLASQNQKLTLDLAAVGNLQFLAPDLQRFPALRLGADVLRTGGTLPAVFNAANEVAVQGFLDQKLSFLGITDLVENTLGGYSLRQIDSIDDIIQADTWGRQTASELMVRKRSC